MGRTRMADGSSQKEVGGGQLEERIDLSVETGEKIAQAQSLIDTSPSNLPESLALLAALEKRCRVGNDTLSLVRVCETSLQLCKDCSDEESLIATLKSLSTRRSQKTKVVSALVHKTIPWVLQKEGGGYVPVDVDSDDQKDSREKIVIALREITDGKIFLEAERARLSRALAIIKERDGNIAGAADVLQEVHVETYGSLSKREKIEFILEQMRLTLAKKDYVRAAIVAGKVSRKHLNEDNMEEYKVKFFTLMAELHRYEKDAFLLAKDYHSIYSTPITLNNDSKWKEALEATVVYLVLSPYSNEQQDMMNRVHKDSNLEKLPLFQSTIKILLKKEIISYPLTNQAELESLSAILEGGEDLTQFWHESFHRRIIQHNVRVVSLYYKRILGSRMAQLLGLEAERLEREISSMVSDGSIYAKIDRPKDIVRFAEPKTPESVLSEWGSDIDKLLHMVETTTHLINKN